MAEKSRIKPERTDAEADAALACAYALLIRAGESAAQADWLGSQSSRMPHAAGGTDRRRRSEGGARSMQVGGQGL